MNSGLPLKSGLPRPRSRIRVRHRGPTCNRISHCRDNFRIRARRHSHQMPIASYGQSNIISQNQFRIVKQILAYYRNSLMLEVAGLNTSDSIIRSHQLLKESYSVTRNSNVERFSIRDGHFQSAASAPRFSTWPPIGSASIKDHRDI